MRWEQALATLPLVAILRGLTPCESLQIAGALLEAGFRCLEVPLNSPNALDSITKIRGRFGDTLAIGAGTVLSISDVSAVAKAGAIFIVTPNTNLKVIEAGKAAGLVVVPGCATPSEAFAALSAGADALKLFPAEALPPATVKAWTAVLPASCQLLPVGGITPTGMKAYLDAGATGFGIGSSIYAPGSDPTLVGELAKQFVQAWHALRSRGN
ncbi:2-dehydro-3-deoxy-6-phosphogalactonate aldolase [Solimonas terrae]|uniref:2-dehydro-3-deoxy-6-phosphogalactonate aldolase n=2 Tax=Solimonas terrae TaxID=1396819 RepID=A0A6M2BTE3_9GAMM|nr:2-dehydro-3-deoxy-6-phosphogalactonate aldolase [Solimonas terrae]